MSGQTALTPVPVFLPWKRRGTSIYFADAAGGFDVRNCPDAENLAAFIVTACNQHAQLVAALELEHAYHTGRASEYMALLHKHGWKDEQPAWAFVTEFRNRVLAAAKGSQS